MADTVANSEKPSRFSIIGRARQLLRLPVDDPQASTKPVLLNYRRPAIGRLVGWLLIIGLGAASLLYGYYFAANAPRLIMPFTVPLVILAVLTIWALPTGEYAPTRLMGSFYWAFFVAFIVWPNYLAVALPGLPWMTFARITGVPMVILMLISLSVSRGSRQALYENLTDISIVWKMLVAYELLTVLSIAISSLPLVSINKVIVEQLTQTAMFFMSCYIFRKEGRLETWVYCLLGTVFFVCLLGFWEEKLGYLPWAGHIPPFLKVADDTVTRILAGGSRSATGIHRISSVQTTPLGLAELVGLTAPFALHLAVGKYPVVVRVLAFLLIPVFIEAVSLTDARLGFVAMLVAGSLYLLLRSVVQWREVRSSIFGPAIVLSYPVIFCALVSATFLIGRVRGKVWGNGSQAASNDARKAQWRMGIPKVIHDPIGHGYGQAGNALGYYNAGGIGTIDSYYLSLLLDTGILGFGLYLGMFLGSAWVAATTVIKTPGTREMRLLMPLSVSLVAFIVVKGVLSQDANHPLVFMMMGAIAAMVHRAKNQARDAAVARH